MRQGLARFCGLTLLIAVAALLAAPQQAFSGKRGELIMFDSKSCTVCRKFEAEVGDDYMDSKAAEVFPLRRVNIHEGEVDFTLALPVTMTPTFVFVDEGAEITRFVGYPGRRHFFTLVEAAADEYRKVLETRLRESRASPAAPR